MEQEGKSPIESADSDSSPKQERGVSQEFSHDVTSPQKILNTDAKTKTMEHLWDPLRLGSASNKLEQLRTLGLGPLSDMLEQQRTALGLGSISKMIEQQRTLGLGSTSKMLEQNRTALGLDSISKFVEQQRSAGVGSTTNMLEQKRAALGFESTSKFLEQPRTLGLGSTAKMLDQKRNALGLDSISKFLEQQRTLGLGSTTKMLEQKRVALGLDSISKFIEQQRTMGLGSITKILEQQRAALSVGSMSKIIEQQRATLGSRSIARAMENLSFHASSALSHASLENLLDELKERTGEAPSSSLVPAPEKHETTLETATDALEGEDHKSLETNRNLALVPTWTLIFLIHALMLSAYLLENWDAIRLSIVDISARMPQTEIFSEVRKFIRTELAGKPGDVRLVRGTNVNLREHPSMKSQIIMSLPKNSPVIVLGKEDRTWLYVSYEHQGYWIEGYISTKHIIKIRKDSSSR